MKSTIVVSRFGILTISAPPEHVGLRGAKMMNIAHLVVMMADSTSETWCELANDAPEGRAVIYRSRFHAVLAKISQIRHFGPLAPLGHMAVNLAGGGAHSTNHGTQDPTQAAKQRPMDPPGAWGAGGR